MSRGLGKYARVPLVAALTMAGVAVGAGVTLLPTAAGATPPTCTDTWKAAVSGNWDTAADWSTGSVPGTSDVACINVAGTYTVTFTPAGGTETVDAVEVGSGVAGNAETLAIAATCSDNVTLVTKNTAVVGDEDSVASTGAVHLTSTSCGNNAALTIGTTMAVANNGTLSVDAGNGGARTIAGSVTNDGTVNINAATTYAANGSSGTWDNAGALNLATGVALTASGAGGTTFTDDTGGSVVTTGTGQLVLDGGNTYNQGAGTTSGNAVLLAGPIGGTGIALHYTGAGASTIIAEGGTGTLDGTISSGQTLTVDGTCSNNAVETVDASEANSGAVHLSSTGCGNSSELAITGGDTFTNQSGGSLSVDAGNGGARTIAGSVTNDGTVNINVATTYAANGTGHTWLNQGALDLNNAALSSPASAGITFTNGAGGSVATTGSSGQLVIDGGNTYNQGAGTTSGNAVLLAGPPSGTGVALHFTGAGAATIETEGVGTLDGPVAVHQTVSVTGTCSNNAVETLDHKVSVKGTVHLTSASCANNATLAGKSAKGKDKLIVAKGGVVTTDASIGGARTIDDDVLLNKGSLLVNTATTYTADKHGLTNKGGTLTIAASVTLTESAVAGSAFTNTSGKINGSGQLTVQSPDTFKQGNATITGATVLVNGAKLAYTGSGAGTIEAEGTTTLVSGAPAHGQTLEVVGTCSLNAVLSTPGSVTDNGAIVLTSSSCGNNATLALQGSGTLTIGANGSLSWPTGNGGTKSVTGSVVNNGTIGDSGVSALSISGTLTEGATGTYAPSVTTGGSSDSVTAASGSLAGTLAPVGSFTASTVYTILHGAFSGAFTTTNGWNVTVGATSVTMTHP